MVVEQTENMSWCERTVKFIVKKVPKFLLDWELEGRQ